MKEQFPFKQSEQISIMGFAQAATTYGIIGVKVWIYKGEILMNSVKKEAVKGGNKDAVAEKN